MQGFFANLPPSGVQFFDRTFERAFPKPLQSVINKSWQKSYGIWKFKMPKQRALVVRNLSWTAFKNDNIGVGQATPVSPGSLSGSLGFQFLIGDRWKIDISNNLQGAGSPTVTGAGGNTGLSLQEFSINGGFDPNGGDFANRYGSQGGFALYARAGQLLESKFFAFQVPPVEVVKVQFKINGWMVPDQLFDHMKETGEWGMHG